ncbi:MAG: hypothetical protein C0401_12575 [Anaerolinea sp.]|nr:hypothetical protein [Anaerolinea sp.]
MSFFERLTKRFIDILGSILLLVVPFPLWLAIAIAIKMGDGGTVLYRRRVVGLDGHEFDAFKFRTMIEDADEYIKSRPDLWIEYQNNIKLIQDPRITKVGWWLRRFSLDEIPQIINVLRGEMSLVGPRMIAPHELDKYGKLAKKRHTFKPGITGLWQVSGRQVVPYEQRIEFDMYYIDHWSLWLDLKILLKTIPVVFGAEGAY